MNKKTWICVVAGALLLGTFKGLCTESTAANDAVLDTIAQINHINWVVNTIKTYNNAVVLEEEYEKISPGRLNLNRIPDEETLGRIKKMLDTLHDLRKKEREIQHWRDNFDANRQRRVRQYWIDKLSKVNSESLIKQAKSCVVEGGGVAHIAVFKMAWATSCAALNLYNDYDNFVSDIEKEANDKLFAVDTEKLDKLHEQNKNLLEDQWRLIKKHGLDDMLRVSDVDIKFLVSCLKDDDHARIYSRIEPLRDRFRLFPVYWYYLSCAALEAGKYEDGLVACDTFFKVNRGLFRNDPMVGGVAINKAFMLPKTDANKPEIRRCLELAWRNDSGCADWRRDYIAAAIYKSTLGDQAAAEKVMAHAIASIEVAIKDRLGGDAGGFDVSLGENLWECKRFLEQLRNENFSPDERRLQALCAGEMTSSIERLYYLGRMRAQDLWKYMSDDVKNVSLSFSSKVKMTGIKRWATATVPVKWFLSGGFSVKLNMLSGGKLIASVSESCKHRKAIDGRMLSCMFEVSGDDLAIADSFRLCFEHPKYPVVFTYASRSPYKDMDKAKPAGVLRATGLVVAGQSLYSAVAAPIARGESVFDGKFSVRNLSEDLFLYDVSFCGKTYRWDPKSDGSEIKYSPDVTAADWRKYFSTVFANLAMFDPSKPIERGIVSTIGIDEENGKFSIKYRNGSDKSVKPAVTIFFLNQYGAIVGRYDDAWRFKKLKSGDEIEQTFEWKSYRRPVFIDVEVGE